MKRTFILSLVAGVVLFVWGFISHALLPWHSIGASKFTSEAAMSQALKENAPQRGVYYLPYSEEDTSPDQLRAFVNVLPHGTEMHLGLQLAIGALIPIVSAFLVLTLLGKTACPSYWGKVGLFSLVGLIIGFVSHAYYWNWFGFSISYVVVTILDTLIGWTLAGLAVARFMRTTA